MENSSVSGSAAAAGSSSAARPVPVSSSVARDVPIRRGSYHQDNRTWLLGTSPLGAADLPPSSPIKQREFRRTSVQSVTERYATELELASGRTSPLQFDDVEDQQQQVETSESQTMTPVRVSSPSPEDYPLPHVRTFVFISPMFPPVIANYVRSLRDKGITVLGIGDAPYDSMSEELRSCMTEYFKILTPGGLNDYDECLKACGYFTWKYGRLHRIESFNETWLPLESRLRQDLNVPGLLPSDLILMRTKSGMRDLFTSHNIPNPGGVIVESLEQLLSFIHKTGGVGYPVVLKPDIGVGAASTYKFNSDEEVKNWYKTEADPHIYIAQHFIAAPIVTFDGLASRTGKLLLASSVEYSDGIMEAVNEHREICFWTTRLIDPILYDIGAKIVKDVLGLRERWFHIEFFRLGKGRYIILEANLRPPGVFIPDMIKYGTETDVYGAYTSLLVPPYTESSSPPKPKHTIVHVIRRTADIKYKLTRAEVEEKLGDALLAVHIMPEVFRGPLGEEGYIVRVDGDFTTPEGEKEAVKKIQKMIQEHA